LQINRSGSVGHSELSENEAVRLTQESDSEAMRIDIVMLIILALAAVYSPLARAQSLSSTSMQNSSPIDLKKLTKKADSGSTQSQLQLGFAYEFGKGVDENIYQALGWYSKAANSGDSAAQTNLGYLYETGPEAIKDLAEAAKWYTRAAVDGDSPGQFDLGLLYLRGQGVQKSTEDALHWIQRAVDADYPRALTVAVALTMLTGHVGEFARVNGPVLVSEGSTLRPSPD